MRKILFFVLLSCFAFGQNKKIDSLKQIINSKKANFETYNLIAWEYIQIDPDITIQYNDLSKKLIRNNKDRAQYLVLSGGIKSMQGDLKTAEKESREGVNLAIKESDYSTIGSGYNILARIYSMLGDFTKMEFYSNKAYTNSLKTNNKKKILSSIINYGSSLAQNGKIEKGIELYKSAEKYFYEGSEYQKGYLYFNLTRLFFNKNDYENALVYLKKSENQFLKIDYKDMFQVYSTYGEIYTELKNEKKALFYLEKAREFSRNEIDLSDISYIQAELFFNVNKLNLAYKNINDAIKLNEKSQNFSRLGEDYLLYSDILRSQKKYSLADISLKKAINIFKENEESENLRLAYERIIPNYFNQNSLSEYLDYFNSYLKLNKDFTDKERTKSLYDLSEKYKAVEKEAKIKSQQLQIEKQKNTTYMAFMGIIILILLSMGAYIWIRARQKKKQQTMEKQIEEFEYDISRLELSNVNNQLNPHEIAGILQRVGKEIYSESSEAYRTVTKLHSIIRPSLTTSLTENLRLQLDQIENILSFEQSKIIAPFEYLINNQIESTNIAVPKLLLVNLVNNAINHGIRKNHPYGGTIVIDIQEDSENHHFTITDTGKGRDLNQTQQTGIGLSAYKKLFSVLNKKNTQNASLEIIDRVQPKGTVVKVIIPKNYQYSTN